MKQTTNVLTGSGIEHRVIRSGKTCDCYVGQLPPFEQWELRYGAHTPECPVYRRSLDPVDDAKDKAIRDHLYG